jgi:hypothetical protein
LILAKNKAEPEMNDLTNPKDELSKKIVTLAETIRGWYNETTKLRKTVKKQFEKILELGLNKYKMDKVVLRRLVVEIFLVHGVSESYLRKLLPVELKDSSKKRISYQQQESEDSDFPNDSTMESVSFQPTGPELNESSLIERQGIETRYVRNDSPVRDPNLSLLKELSEVNKKVESLEERVRWLSKPFTAKTYLQALVSDIPLVAEIDPVKKSIVSIDITIDG